MKKTIITMTICIISIVLLVRIKDQYSYLLLWNSNYGMPALIERGEVDNLFIGSSTFRQGLDIDVLEKELPGTSYILTYNGNQPVFEYMQLKKLLDNGVKIKNLYVDMYAYMLSKEPWLDDEKLLMELTLPEKAELYRMLPDRSPKVFWQLFVSANNEQILTWPVNKQLLDTQFKNGGTLVRSEGLSEEAYEAIQPIGSDGKINNEQIDAVVRIIELCRDHNISVIFIETPKAEAIMQSENYPDIMKRYSQLLEDYGAATICYIEDILNPEDFADGVHLSSTGRAKYTAWLTESLK